LTFLSPLELNLDVKKLAIDLTVLPIPLIVSEKFLTPDINEAINLHKAKNKIILNIIELPHEKSKIQVK
jgi:hypothetical protein